MINQESDHLIAFMSSETTPLENTMTLEIMIRRACFILYLSTYVTTINTSHRLTLGIRGLHCTVLIKDLF